MKKILFTLALFAGMAASAQVKVGNNPTTVNANAVFEMESTTKGLLLPRMTSVQRAAITSPAGLEVYDTTTNTIWYHNGTTWVNTLASTTTSSNGLTSVSGDIRLGGALTGATTISGVTATNKLAITATGLDAVNIDSNTLSVDATNNRIGINTATPASPLDVVGQITATQIGAGTGSALMAKGTSDSAVGFSATSAATDNKVWDIWNTGTTLNIRATNDANSASATAMTANRSGTSISSVIFPSGSIGIGTSSPGAKLHVSGSGGNTVDFQTTGRMKSMSASPGIFLSNAAGTTDYAFIGKDDSNSNHAFGVWVPAVAWNALNVTTTGNVGIGTSSPTSKLDVNGQMAANNIGGGSASAVLAKGTTDSAIGLTATSSATDNKTWDMWTTGTTFNLRAVNDANSSSSYAMIATRSGTSISKVCFPTGNVGVGTNSPTFPLDVQTTTNTSNANYGYLAPSGAGTISGNSTTAAFSIRAYGRIVCPEFNAVSDRRIKDVIGASDSSKDLDLLNRIKITDYEMKDKVQFGNKQFKKVIAQELEEVFPQVVNTMTNYVPNVYQMADQVAHLGNNTYKVTFKNKVNFETKTTGQLKLYNEKNPVVANVVSKGNNEIVFTTNEKVNNDKLFVFGEEVTDFRAVDYEALTTLNISATQELYKQIQELKAQNAKLTAGVAKVEKVQAEYAELAAEVKELKAALGVTAQK